MIIKYFNTLLIFLLIVLHIFDGGMTMFLVYTGHAVEINPIMREALIAGPMAFIAIKSLLAFVSTFFLWLAREEFLAAPLLLLLILIYVAMAETQLNIFCNI